MHLYRRGKSGVYYYQRRVPDLIKHYYNNKTHIKFSLQTNNATEAKRLASIHSARLAYEFTQYESSVSQHTSVPPAKISRLALMTANSWLSLVKDAAQSIEDQPDNVIDSFLIGLNEEQYLIASTVDKYKEEVNAESFEQDLIWSNVLNTMSSEQQSLVTGLPLNQKIKLFQLIAKHTHPLSLQVQQELLQLYPDLAAVHPYDLPKELPTLEDACNQFLKNKHAEKPMSLKLEQRYLSAFESLQALIGKDCMLNLITRSHIRELRTLLSKLPANIKKKPETRNLSLYEIFELVKENKLAHLPLLSVTSINQRLEALNSLFQFCIQESWLTINPADKIRVQKTVANKDMRLPYSPELLDQLLQQTKSTEHYWTVRLGLCGLRMNEIVQLTPSDIKQSSDGVWFIDINKNDGKAVKTLSSIRQIPIPNHLLELGFIEFVTHCTTATLFDVQVSKTTGYRSDVYSKRYAYFTKCHKLKADKVSFHSLRHNFKDYALMADLPEAAYKQLGGWTDDSVSAAYGSGYTIKKLSNYMNSLPYLQSF
ncbi:DUF6538 domain-containing protein [Photobacterium carnosum]|uniref:DUF6538 domain-containing protein n=1 Tax=Photobacterium carnosum TaxID=2023717 RepID=UPI001E3454ED|nr:DUF6538 domain-containing protein [Photobacterium carnosum]MCD9499355.1 tyrosine-type recombinase/integrase [Photobacterium carnosum]